MEQRLLAEVGALMTAARDEPALLARPVRVVVASGQLRSHVASRLVAVHGALAGVRVQTLQTLARELLQAAGVEGRDGDRLFGVLTRRAASECAPLRDALGGLDDGYGACTEAISDLLDAGFDPAESLHAEAVADAIEACGLPPATRRRVEAIVEAAAATARALREHGARRSGGRLLAAAEILRDAPDTLAARAVLVHGYADATGAVSELIDALVRFCGARLFVDLPPDPAEPARLDLGAAFVDRLLARVGAHDAAVDAMPAPPRMAALRAVGTDAEVRAVADRVLALIEDGVPPESIGLVVRDTGPYAASVRTQLGRLGIPFSAPGTPGAPDASARRTHALLAVLAEGPQVVTDRWLDACAARPRLELADLRLGLRAQAAHRLDRLADLDVTALLRGSEGLSLPARHGLADAEIGDAPTPVHRRLPGVVLRRAVAAARETRERLVAWPPRARLADHVAALRSLAHDAMGWEDPSEVVGWVAPLELELGDVELAFDEFVLLLRRAASDAGQTPFGGEGGGVRFLGLVEARAQTFDHLFVLGVNRGQFPQTRPDDPLLPESVRLPLEPVLPEIPLRSRAFEEEHHLFAQLLAAAPHVTLAWQAADDEGRVVTASPFVERMRGAGTLPEPVDVSGPGVPGRGPRVRTAAEAALVEGLHGDDTRHAALLALAAREVAASHAGLAGIEPDAWAAARCRVRDELGTRPDTARLGPYFGFVGGRGADADPRDAPLYVTQLERMLRCPWQHFLTHVLRVEPAPDAQDLLPGPMPLLVGQLVHDVLERMVVSALGDSSGEAGAFVPWPGSGELDRTIAACAAALVEREGVGMPGFDRLLAAIALPLVQAARAHEWPEPDGEVRCVGAEQSGELRLGDGAHVVHFRADRVDRAGDHLVLVDYKTGRPETQGKLAEHIARGERLQAAAYAFASGGVGRYLYLAEGARKQAVVSVAADEAELREAFENVVDAAWVARDAGAFFPRLTQPNSTRPAAACKHCDVREACSQGDAGTRARFAAWVERDRGDSPADAQALALLRVAEGREA